jgi:membrane protein DedA with SNARE-associated domain
VLGWFSNYGLPVLFFVLGASAFGFPVPVKLLMLVVGATVQSGDIQFWHAIVVGSVGAVAGDQAGYFLGYAGGRAVVENVTARYGGHKMLEEAQWSLERWGSFAVFFSRWLVTPIGPWLNLICGSVGYSWTSFTIVGVAGEAIWVLIYVLLGVYFSDRIQDTADLLVSLTWLILGLIATSYLAWKIYNSLIKQRVHSTVEAP